MKRLMNDLPLANPGFNWLGKGMVLRLPKMDPRLTRQRKIKRRMKDYVPPEEPEEQIDWWDDPEFEEKMADVFAETALSIGLDENVLRDELGLGEGSPLLREASSKNWTQSRTEKGNLHSPRTSRDRGTPSQTDESSQTATGSTTPPITLTDEQIDALKANLEKLGLDVDVAMAELGLGEGATASTTASQTTGEGVGDGGETSIDEVEETSDGATKVLERPTQQSGYPQYPDELPDKYRKLQEWFRDEKKQVSTEKERDMLEKMYLQMKKELNWKKRNIVTYVFGGTMGAAGLSKEVEAKTQMPAWNVDLYGNEIPGEHIINYPGAEEGTFPTGKSLQAENAKDVEIGDRELNLICYSGGADACLMFARDRLDEGKKINSIVLLGPTLTGGIEDGIDISSTDSNGVPIWKSIMDDLIRDGTNIIVVNDSAKPELELFKPPEPPPGEVYGKYIYMPPDSTRGHYMKDGTGTNDSEVFREDIYKIIREWQKE
jgi:hypothetical protein